MDLRPVECLRNFGPKSRADLNAIGIHTVADLEARGAVDTYIALKAAGFRVSRTMLWALLGALSDTDFRAIPAEVKAAVLRALPDGL